MLSTKSFSLPAIFLFRAWALALLALVAFPITARCANVFQNSGSLTSARNFHTATVLADGKVLIAGGKSLGIDQGYDPAPWTAEIYDPATRTSVATGSMRSGRSHHVATLLANNKVLVTSGSADMKGEIFDPATGTWSDTGPLNQLRGGHTATLLANGKVLVAGGYHAGNLSSAELYDPETNTWTPTGSLNNARSEHTATLLQNGKVLVVGDRSQGATKSSELYDPATGLWTVTGDLSVDRTFHTATLLSNGKVLVAGTVNSYNAQITELYDPATGLWTATGSLGKRRYYHAAVLLQDQTVLVTAGLSAYDTTLNYSEIYHPESGTWTSVDPVITARYAHTASLLPDGSVFVAGGNRAAGGPALAQTETYAPSPLNWIAASDMDEERSQHTATLLDSGKVLVAGGLTKGVTYATSTLYDPNTGTWADTGSMSVARYGHTALRLGNGNVFVIGGESSAAEIYRPATQTWSSAGSFPASQSWMSATLLKNGKVLVAGGSNGSQGVPNAKLYDPTTNRWSATGSLTNRRALHTATLLDDGRVLVVGGFPDSFTSAPLGACEIYNPQTGTWTGTAPALTARYSHSAVLLPSGKVLVFGGCDQNGNYFLTSELYDPSSGTWSETGRTNRTHVGHATTLLADGRILAAGGLEKPIGNDANSTSATEIYDENTGAWTPSAPLNTPRSDFAAVSLANGKVLSIGGYRGRVLNAVLNGEYWTYNSSAEIFDPQLPLIQLEQPLGSTIPAGIAKDFGDVASGGQASLQFTLRNAGTADLTNISMMIDGDDADSFNITTPVSATEAAPGAQTPFTISFSPASVGTKSATLYIDSDTCLFTIQLRGSSYLPVPEIAVFHPAGTELKDGKFKKSFGTIKIGKSGATKTFTIKNTGTARLTKLAVSKDGKDKGDFVIEPLAKAALAPGASMELKVVFKPTDKGTRNAAIHIRSNDADESPFDISLTGMGAKP